MLDSRGYLKVVDFGFAKCIRSSNYYDDDDYDDDDGQYQHYRGSDVGEEGDSYKSMYGTHAGSRESTSSSSSSPRRLSSSSGCSNKSFTLCGTPFYLGPYILLSLVGGWLGGW
jgi:serine/threonine protein kinase